jgi:hypothetical protein
MMLKKGKEGKKEVRRINLEYVERDRNMEKDVGRLERQGGEDAGN